MDPETADTFDKLREVDPSNRFCLECDSRAPQWCALSYGAFVCLNCSGIHRSLGVHLSFVRSSTMDSWQPMQLQLMKAGGNQRCKDFFIQHGIWNLPIRERYATKAAAYYRALLRSEIDKSAATPEPLRPGEAAETELRSSSSLGSNIRSLGSQSGISKTHENEDADGEGFVASLQQQAAAASAAAAAAAASSGAAMESALQSVSSFVIGARDYTTKTFEAAGESAFIERAKGSLQSGGEWIAEQGKRITTTWKGNDLEESQSQLVEEDESGVYTDSVASASSNSVLQSMGSLVASAKQLTSRSLSTVSLAVRNSGTDESDGSGGVIEKALEGISSITTAASTWLQPSEIPKPNLSRPPGAPTGPESTQFL